MNPRKSDFELYSDLLDIPALDDGFYEPGSECEELGRTLNLPDRFVDDAEGAISISEGSPPTYWTADLFDVLHSQIIDDEVVFGLYPRRLFGEETLQALQIGDVYQLLDIEIQYAGFANSRWFVSLSRIQAEAGLGRPSKSR